jgi:ATP-dependent Clp protease ATP-binding subunit ClpC
VARLLGAPPGYVGHESGGQLTEAVRKRAYQVILLDELEKAHTDVLLAFLQVLDEGHLTDGRGRRVDFKNTVLFATSNLGSRDVAEALSGRSVGFGGQRGGSSQGLSEKAIGAAKKALPIELFNRFDEVLFFAPLSRPEVRSIAKKLMGELSRMLEARDVLLDSGGFQPELGARPMRRVLARLVEAPIAEMLLRGELRPGMVALVGEEDGNILVDAVDRTASAIPPAVALLS